MITATEKYITAATALTTTATPTPPNAGKFSLTDFLTRHNIAIEKTEPYDGGAVMHHIASCPICQHKDAAIIESAKGAFGYKCFRDSCPGKNWDDFREHLEPGHKARKANYKANGERFAYTDAGNAERLAASRYGVELLFVLGLGWHYFDGHKWQREDGDAHIWQCAIKVIREIMHEAEGLDDLETRKKIIGHALKSESTGGLRAMITQAENLPHFRMTARSLDSDPNLLNVQNGIVDLRTGELIPHDPACYMTRLTNAAYHPGADCPVWRAHLDRIFCGDAGLIDFVRIAAGLTLTGLTDSQSFFLLHGAGANGKSKFLEGLAYALGEYAGEIAITSLTAKRDNPAGTSDLARLAGIRLLISSENGEGWRLNESFIKKITGGGKVVAAFKFQNEFEFSPEFKLWLDTNHEPRVTADYAMARRVKKIPFLHTIPEAERDNDFDAKLHAEADGILAWAVSGAVDWYTGGKRLDVPESVVKATSEYITRQDDFLQWRGACCTESAGAWAHYDTLYTSFCEYIGSDRVTKRAFTSKLVAAGFSADKRNGKQAYFGIGLLAT